MPLEISYFPPGEVDLSVKMAELHRCFMFERTAVCNRQKDIS